MPRRNAHRRVRRASGATPATRFARTTRSPPRSASRPRARAGRPDCRGPVREPGARSRRGGRAERRDARARRRSGAGGRIRGVSVARGPSARARIPGRCDAPGAAVRGVRGHARRARLGDGRLRAQRRPGPGRGGGDAATRRPKPTRARRARGLQRRARAALRAPVRALFRNAVLRDGKRLVLCGHSLGGRGGRARAARPAARRRGRGGSRGRRRGRRAVDGPVDGFRRKRRRKRRRRETAKNEKASRGFWRRTVSWRVWGSPRLPVDEATRAYAETRGWTRAFVNVCSREDFVPRLMLAPRAARSAVSEKALFQSEKKRRGGVRRDARRRDDRSSSHEKPREVLRFVAPRVRARLVCAHGGSRRRGHRRGRARDAWPPRIAPARRGDERPGGVFSPRPVFFSARKAREALAEHTMRAHRARLLVTCADALAKARNDDDASYRARTPKKAVRAAVRFGFPRARGAFGRAKAETRAIEASPTRSVCPHPRATRSARRLSRARRPPPHKSSGTASRDRRSWSPCAGRTWSFARRGRRRDQRLAVQRRRSRHVRLEETSSGQRASSLAFSSRATRFLRASTPHAQRRARSRASVPGGGDARDWSRARVALRGEFGDARVAARRRGPPVSRSRSEPTLAS